MKRSIIFFLSCCCFQWAIGQKTLQKQWHASQIQTLVIQGDGFSEITFQSTEADNITIKASMEGEYFENVLLQTKIENQTLYISENFTPFFKPKNDKLAAHKVMAVQLIVMVPKTVSLQCSTNSANVSAQGTFKALSLQIENGHCTLTNIDTTGQIATKRGAIVIYGSVLKDVAYYSKYGAVVGCTSTQNAQLVLESVYGTITCM